MLSKGITGIGEFTVTNDDTALRFKSGCLEVLATPRVVSLVEETAWKSVSGYLDEGFGTVGTLMNLKHIAATPVGMKVRCETTLSEIDRRRLVFEFSVYDEKEKIAEGTHERFIVENERFISKAYSKKEK